MGNATTKVRLSIKIELNMAGHEGSGQIYGTITPTGQVLGLSERTAAYG
jgi:hypothetical protein